MTGRPFARLSLVADDNRMCIGQLRVVDPDRL